ncbi:MAG: hypothetical protein Q7J64_05895 [Elusimicrobiota bacterium]|nr:hypothetical protein [Elusimicrobiota bacterium]
MIKTFSLVACLIAGSASAQTAVSVRTGQTMTVAPIVPFSAAPGGAMLVSPLSGLGLTPSLSAPTLAPSLTATPAALAAVPTALTAAVVPAAAITPAATAKAALLQTAAVSPRGLTETSAVASLSAAAVADKTPARLDAAFDGSVTRTGGTSPVAAPSAAPRRSFLRRAALTAGVFLATPAIALAAAAPSAVEPGAMALVGNYAPLATAIAAVIGALFGLWSTRTKDGTSANAGRVFAATLSHGAIAGAAAFALIDLTRFAFLGGSAAALAPMTAAVATAALAQSAFSAKFTDPATTSADRVMGAFPAVALAFGIGIGAFALAAPVGIFAIATASLMATGAATALYTALFSPEKSAASGPAAMGRGFVLQTLMTGLALSLGPTPYALFFFGLGMFGFATVMRTTATEAWAHVPESIKNRFKK